jgi:hypothetical protein
LPWNNQEALGMKTMEGTVLLVQESRFMVESDQGEAHLFILSHRAPLEPQQLPPLQHQQARVRVSYDEAPHVIGYTAHAVDVIASAEQGRSGGLS